MEIGAPVLGFLAFLALLLLTSKLPNPEKVTLFSFLSEDMIPSIMELKAFSACRTVIPAFFAILVVISFLFTDISLAFSVGKLFYVMRKKEGCQEKETNSFQIGFY